MKSNPEDLIRQANQKLKGGFLGIGGKKYDEAADLLNEAACAYKLQKEWKRAADCFVKAAQYSEEFGDTTGQASYLLQAGNSLNKISPDVAADAYEQCCAVYTKNGRFAAAAKVMKTLAEEYESQRNEKEACKYYQKAAEFYSLDEYGKTSYTQCIIQYARLAAKLEDKIDEAIKIFEQEAEKAVNNKLMVFGAREYLFDAGILQLAKGDAVTASVSCEEYENQDPRFAGSPQGRLLKQLCTAFEQNEADQFTNALIEYDRISRLDAWRTHFLSRVKQLIAPSATAPLEAPPDDDGGIDLS